MTKEDIFHCEGGSSSTRLLQSQYAMLGNLLPADTKILKQLIENSRRNLERDKHCKICANPGVASATNRSSRGT